MESERSSAPPPDRDDLEVFGDPVVDRVQAAGGRWPLPAGELRIPRQFGFCRGVTRALAMLEHALNTSAGQVRRWVLLGEIIHNPWVNDHFRGRGVKILSPGQREQLEAHIGPADCAVIPAFGVPQEIQRRLEEIGCSIIDTTCGDVRALWHWAERAAGEGFGVLIYGRADHDETVVTKSRLAAAGHPYLVVGNLDEAEAFCRLVRGQEAAETFRERFTAGQTNAESPEPLLRLAQVSQTTMLYEKTLRLRDRLRAAFADRFGETSGERLRFQPTVCRATQDRQAAAIELCRSGCDLVVVVGGHGSSNTRHLFELASGYGPAVFIEDARSILSAERIVDYRPESGRAVQREHWMPGRRPIRVGVLAGASSPKIVIGQVLRRLAEVLGED
jgi:4-hydroxy-3-methylbut-2-enyl diphosphate reductase